PKRTQTNVSLQSLDPNGTWTSAQTITSGPTDENGPVDSEQYGDYNGLSFRDGILFASWTDRSLLRKEEIWSTTRCIDPLPPASGNGVRSGNQVVVTWAPSTLATKYRLGRSEMAGGSYIDIATTSQTSFVDLQPPGG